MPLACVGDPWVTQSKVPLPMATHCVPCVTSQLLPHSHIRVDETAGPYVQQHCYFRSWHLLVLWCLNNKSQHFARFKRNVSVLLFSQKIFVVVATTIALNRICFLKKLS